MSARPLHRLLMTAASLALAGGIAFLSTGIQSEASVRRASERGQSLRAVSTHPGDAPPDAIVDLNFPAVPSISMDVIQARLVILGANPAAADLAVVRAIEDVSGLDAVVAEMGLPPAEADKASELLRAWVAGRPVSLVGLEPSAMLLARVEELMVAGMDPDVAAWTALRDQSMDRLAQDGSSGVQVNSANTDREQISLDGLGGNASANAFCKTCPSFDFMMGEPTATYQTVSGAVSSGADCKVYRFIARTGRTYRFTFCEGGGAASFDSVLEAYSTGCIAVGSNDDACTLRSRLDVVNNGDGYLYVKVRDKNQAGGTYTLAYSDITTALTGTCPTCPSFDHGTFTPTATWQTHDSTVVAPGCRVYRFYGYVNHSYVFSMCRGGGSATFDAGIDTFRANCGVGPSADDSCGLAPEVNVALNATGYMYVKVRGAGGSFRLAYKDTTTDCPACPGFNHGPFTPGLNWSAHSGTLASGQPCKKIAFGLVNGRTYRWSFCQGGGSAAFDSKLSLLSSGCGVLASNDNTCGLGAELTYTATASGTHFIDLASNAGSGSYVLAYAEICRPCGDPHATLPAPPTASYQLRPDSILANGCRVYGVPLQAGKVYRFSTCADTGASAAFDTTMSLAGPGCVAAASNNDACALSSEIDYLALVTGTHYLTVAGNGAASGAFTLATRQIARTCPLSNASLSPTTSFQTVAGSIVRGGNVVYQLNTTATKNYIVTLCPADFATATAAFDSVVTVRDAAGGCALIGTNGNACGDDGKVQFVAPTGNTSVIINGENPSAAGAFTLAYREIPCSDCPNFDIGPNPVPGSAGWQAMPSDTLLAGCTKVHRWDVTTGQKWTFGFCNAAPYASFNTKLTVFASNGTSCTNVGAVNDLSCTQGGKTLSESTQYTVPAGITRLFVKVEGKLASDFGAYVLGYRKQ